MLILKKEKKTTTYNVLSVPSPIYERLKTVSADTGIPIGRVAEQALTYALVEYEVVEEEV